jgi:uncharacterized protein (TIGR02391 family)
VLAFCRAELMQQNYFHAVLEAAKSVAGKLRTLTGVSGGGSPQVDGTCSLSSGPRVVFNSLATDLGAIRADRHCNSAQGFVQRFPESNSPRAEAWVPQMGLVSETRNTDPTWGNVSAHGETACI